MGGAPINSPGLGMADLDRQRLVEMYRSAVAAAHPSTCLVPNLPAPPEQGRILVVGAGKAAAAMAATAEAHYRQSGTLDRVSGFTTAAHGYRDRLPRPHPSMIEIIEARHPTPDSASEAAARRALSVAASAGPEDILLVLLSGGASALWAAPAPGLDLAAKIELTRGLLKCGADIHEMNAVRRHLSAIKGGRLAAAAKGARVITLAISDVPGDDPATIGSGPTVPDPTTLADARAILRRRAPVLARLQLMVPPAVTAALADPANETRKHGDPAFARTEYRIIATPRQALDAAAGMARSTGLEVIDLGDAVTGEARDVARSHAAQALALRAAGRRAVILSGGELSVTVANRAGRGGRSQEYALALAVALNGTPGISGIAADTDGVDGGEGSADDPAGALVDPTTLARAASRGLSAARSLADNDATPFFAGLGDLIATGPTHTNVNDFRAILIDGSG
jgi:hydroxypyruvate reductase